MFSYNEKLAYEKGYRVQKNQIFSNKGLRKYYINKEGYPEIIFSTGSRTDNSRKYYHLPIHRLVAYQKYGDKIYQEGIEVRHKDGNSLNFLNKNILIGTRSDNMMDIPKEIRVKIAGNANKKFSDKQAIEIKRYHSGSYIETMEYFGIHSRGTLWYILNKR